MAHIIETERVIIRELLPDDDEGMFLLDSDPDVHRYVGKNPVKTIEQSRNVIAMIRQQYADLGIGRWAMLDKSTNDFIGWTGFKLIQERTNGHENYYDFGYRLRKAYWGRGYATESGRAALQYGIEQLGFKGIFATTDVNNLASRNVLEKLGFTFTGIFGYDGTLGWREPGEPTTWYEYKPANK